MTRVIELEERATTELPRSALDTADAERIWQAAGKFLDIEFPSPRTYGRWRLSPTGWVGHVPIHSGLALHIQPKVPLNSIFGMLEYVYGLKQFRLFDDLVALDSLAEIYGRLARILARSVRDRVRKGLYRAYLPRHERLAFVRGRPDIPAHVRAPWRTNPPCHFEELTADLEDNRILAWTLHVAGRSELCAAEPKREVLGAFRALSGHMHLREATAHDCIGRTYQRLNEDYAPMHALCRLLLESSNPTHERGERNMIPFVVNMETLFEDFVAAWLRANVPAHIQVEPHHKIYFATGDGRRFDIDILLRDRTTGQPLAVLDTKYKAPDQPSSRDVQQVLAYAEVTRAPEAILVYPSNLSRATDLYIGDSIVRVRSLTFDVGTDLETAGRKLLSALELEPIGGVIGIPA